jgi:DNA-binding CsgD family transcriptional regulator
MSRHERTAVDVHQLRNTGLAPVGDRPWGTHICLFYETPQDLYDVHAEYFGAGLASGEFCIWALSDPINRENAIEALRKSVPDFDKYLRDGQIEFIPGYQWYLRGEEFDPQRITGGWHAKLDEALARGFDGMRVSGNAFWFETGLWTTFREYEAELDRSLAGRKMIVLCTYSLKASRAVDVLDVARTHNFSIAKRDGRWDFLETPELAQAKREIGRLNGAIDILSNPFPGRRHLTHREQVVLAQVVKGASSKEAARNLSISHRTVEFHRKNIMRKLGARNVIDLLGIVLGNRLPNQYSLSSSPIGADRGEAH